MPSKLDDNHAGILAHILIKGRRNEFPLNDADVKTNDKVFRQHRIFLRFN